MFVSIRLVYCLQRYKYVRKTQNKRQKYFRKRQTFSSLFLDTFYYFIGFAGYDGRSVMPVLQQDLVKDAQPATPIEIETYMTAIGFTKKNNEGRFANSMYEVWDLVPRNVLKDKDGDIYVVDAEIKGL